jgi:aromatic-L-amino-acid decarboxylase
VSGTAGGDERAGYSGDMPADEFRRYGHAIVDRLTQYLEEVESHPVLSRVKPGDVRASLPAEAPVAGEDMAKILADFETKVLPGITHWNHPGFMAYFAITGSGPGVLGEMLAAGLNVNGMLWRGSPAATELEEVTLDWLRQLMGLPEPLFGEITDTASSSTLYALAAAREYARSTGRAGVGRLRVYCSTEAHSSVDKAIVTLGLGTDGLRRIPADDRFRMRPDLLAAAIAEDRAAGLVPFAVVATVGTTTTTAIDPVPEIADICDREKIWLHVDAAYAGIAAIVPEKRYALAGAERAHSLVVNPHKWLFVPIDCSVLYTREPAALKAAFTLPLEMLYTPEKDVTNLMDYGLSLGRRFRSLKLWFVLRYFGAEGLAARLREHMRLAQVAAAWVERSENFELVAPVEFSTIVFRYAPPGLASAQRDAANARIVELVNAGGEIFLSGPKVGGAPALRLAIGNLRTTERHVLRALELIQQATDT